jgi:8-oxo-dGTP diphosphatase
MAIKNFNVGVKAIIVEDEKLLVVKHRTKDFWDVPGGRIDDDETIEATLRREISEELPSGTDVEIGNILGAYRLPGTVFPDGSGLMLLMYRAAMKFPAGEVEVSDEHSEARWVTFAKARELGSLVVTEAVKFLEA